MPERTDDRRRVLMIDRGADITARLAASLSVIMESSEQGHADDCEADCQYCLDRLSALAVLDLYDNWQAVTIRIGTGRATRPAQFPAIFETEPTGVGGAHEASYVYRFCSRSCRNDFRLPKAMTFVLGTDAKSDDDEVCCHCGRPLAQYELDGEALDLPEFLEVNAGAFDSEELSRITSLEPGESVMLGGGAAPLRELKRTI